MELRQLHHFLQVVEHGSFSGAAAALDIGQPGLTKSVRRLELEIGVSLLVRRARGVEPTEHGAILVKHAKLIDVERREALAEITALLGGRSGTLAVGAGPAWRSRYLPEAIARLHAERPDLRVRVSSAYPEDLLEALRHGDLDLVVGAVPDGSDQELAHRVLARDTQSLLVRSGHPLVGRTGIALPELLDYPFILSPARTRVRQRLESVFREHGLDPPQPAIETDSLPFALASLRSGNFLGIATDDALTRPEAHDIVRLDCPRLEFHRDAGVVYRRRGTLPAAAAALVDTLVAVCREQGRIHDVPE